MRQIIVFAARALAPLVLSLSTATPATGQQSVDPSVIEEDAGLPEYTIYRPQSLNAGGRLLPMDSTPLFEMWRGLSFRDSRSPLVASRFCEEGSIARNVGPELH